MLAKTVPFFSSSPIFDVVFLPRFYYFFFFCPDIHLPFHPCSWTVYTKCVYPRRPPVLPAWYYFCFWHFFPRSLSLSLTLSSSVSLPPKTEVTTKEYAIIIIITTISRSAYTRRVVSAPVPRMRRAIQCTDWPIHSNTSVLSMYINIYVGDIRLFRVCFVG